MLNFLIGLVIGAVFKEFWSAAWKAIKASDFYKKLRAKFETKA